MALALLPAGHAYPDDASLVLWYNLDEGSGAVAGDLSGYDNNATLINTPTWRSGANCMASGCLEFDNASSEQMYTQYTASLNITGQFTYTMALKLGGFGAFMAIFDAQSGNNAGFELVAISNGTLRPQIRTAPAAVFHSTTALAVGVWYNLTMLWNGTDFVLYVNGQYNASVPRTANLTENIQLRQWATSDNTSYFNGSMDCISLYNRTLTAGERATNICTGVGDPDITPPIVTINSPTNTTYATNFWINVTLNENTGSVIAQLDATTNYSLTNSSGNWNYGPVSATEGARRIQVFANDSAGNMNNSQTVYFTIDTTAPQVTINSPTNATYNVNSTTPSNTSIWVNVTLNENGGNVTAQLNNTANFTLTNTSGNWNFKIPGLTIGAYNITIFANDSLGNMNSSQKIYFSIVNGTVVTNITLFDEVTEATVIGTSKWTIVTLRYSDTYAANATYNATNGTALFIDVNNTAWVVDAGSTGSDFPYARTTLLGANQLTATIYLIPTGADAVYVVFTLNDPSGAFNGALVKLKKYINNSLIELSRTNFDAANNAPFYMLKNNRYQLFINNTNEERNLGWYIPTAAATQTITINNVSLAPTVTLSTKDVTIAVNYTNASNYTGTIGFQYRDALNKTNGVEFWIYNGTNESLQLYYTSGNSSIFYATYTGITNTNITYLTKWRVNHSTYGQLEGRQLISMFNMALRVGLGSAFSQRWHYTLVAMIAIIFTAGIFTARTSALGGTFLMGEVLLFSWWGWLSVSGIVISVLGLLVIVAMLTKRGGI